MSIGVLMGLGLGVIRYDADKVGLLGCIQIRVYKGWVVSFDLDKSMSTIH